MKGLGRLIAPGVYPVVAPAFDPATPWTFLPGGHQVKGCSVVPNYVAGWDATWANVWWANWSSNRANFQAQVQLAKAAGANSIAVFGTTRGRYNGTITGAANTPITLADYVADLDDALSYLRAQGMYCYFRLSGDADWNAGTTYGYTPSLAWAQAEFASIVRFLAKYADVVWGVEIMNEALVSGGWPHTATNGADLYATLKAAAPMFSYAYSATGVTSAGALAALQTTAASASPAFDHLDAHVYYPEATNPAAGNADSLLSSTGARLLVGEFGANQGWSTTNRAAYYTGMKALQANVTSGRKIGGSHAWCAEPQGPNGGSPQFDWALWDLTGTARTDMESVFATFAA